MFSLLNIQMPESYSFYTEIQKKTDILLTDETRQKGQWKMNGVIYARYFLTVSVRNLFKVRFVNAWTLQNSTA